MHTSGVTAYIDDIRGMEFMELRTLAIHVMQFDKIVQKVYREFCSMISKGKIVNAEYYTRNEEKLII
jgi:hypothetical protein